MRSDSAAPTRWLLDANVLIALAIGEHEHHAQVTRWVGRERPFTICPITEGALTRFLLRLGERAATAQALLSAMYDSQRCEFWPDEVSYATADLAGVIGHKQATDHYLVALARYRGARLATLDRALAHAFREDLDLIGE